MGEVSIVQIMSGWTILTSIYAALLRSVLLCGQKWWKDWISWGNEVKTAEIWRPNPAFLCSSTRAPFHSSGSSENRICCRVWSRTLCPGEKCVHWSVLFCWGRGWLLMVDVLSVHTRERKSQGMGCIPADGGGVNSDGAQTLGKPWHSCGKFQDLP